MAREIKRFFQCVVTGKRDSIRDESLDASTEKTVYVLKKQAYVGRTVQVLKDAVESPSYPIDKSEWDHWTIVSVDDTMVVGSSLTARQRIECGYPEGRG